MFTYNVKNLDGEIVGQVKAKTRDRAFDAAEKIWRRKMGNNRGRCYKTISKHTMKRIITICFVGRMIHHIDGLNDGENFEVHNLAVYDYMGESYDVPNMIFDKELLSDSNIGIALVNNFTIVKSRFISDDFELCIEHLPDDTPCEVPVPPSSYLA